MLHVEVLPRIHDVGWRLHTFSDALQVQLDGRGWHDGVRACHAICPTAELDFSPADSTCLWSRWRAHHAAWPSLEHSGTPAGPLPGWYGFLGYDAGRAPLRPIEQALPIAALGFFPCVVVEYDDRVEVRFLSGHESLARRITSSLRRETAMLPGFRLLTPFTNNTTQARYNQGFARIIEYILAGDCYQVNYAHRFSARYGGHAYAAYERLRIAMNSPFSGYLRHRNGSVLSFSPEQFVSLRDGQMQTAPIKGTRPRAPDAVQDAQQKDSLATSSKDRAENVMIVDLLRNDLSRVAQIGSVRVPELFHIESFTHVHHMISTVTASLKPGHNAVDVLEACFPGGSITGAPKRRACEIIAELEEHPRSAYCGSLFYVDVAGRMQSNILIRTVVAEDDQLYCWGGGGIVADSDCQQEYEETLHKVGRLMALFGG